jgi:hydroxymethylglutaryl-CoA lyase
MDVNERVEIVETVRDAWQGLTRIPSTDEKVGFIRGLLSAGFPCIDVGSFVSPRRVPAMADTADVLQRLADEAGSDLEGARLTALVASANGLSRLLAAPGVSEVLYPFSLSESFQRRNTERGREEALALLADLTAASHEAGRTMYATISMAFGNNEGDPYDTGELRDWIARLHDIGVDRIGLADTTAMATPASIAETYAAVAAESDRPVPGAHLHVTPENQDAMVGAALDAGVRSFDAALGALGGCQFAMGAVSNVSTLPLVHQLHDRGLQANIPDPPLAGLDAAARTLATG